MPRWITLDTADLADTTIAKLLTALRTKALGEGQTDPSPRIIADVVTDIRRKIASCRTNRVDADDTKIPASLKRLACDLIVFELLGRLKQALSEDERRKLDRHTTTLNRIASCEDVIEQPDDAEAPAVEAASGTPSISNDRADARRRRRAGL